MKICIAGGGTAGWIAAYFLLNDHPGDHEIVVIESSQLGIIGAGEGSTGTMIELLNGTYFNKKVDLDDFLKKTGGTRKQGIFHNNWTGDGAGYFAPIDQSPTWHNFEDTFFKFALGYLGKEKVHLSSSIGIEYDYNLDKQPNAIHFDGHEVGKYFKNDCIETYNTTVIDAVIKDANLNSAGNISSVLLDNGETVEADFFVDCSGFARILSKKVGMKWKSYTDYLPMDSAIPFVLEYEEGETPNTYTSANALSSGWMWEIPLQSRKGCGYVYDSNFLTKDQAIEEVQNFVGKPITPIKHINFEAGCSDAFWKKNVLALGLSSAFVEPLEATSIHSTIIQLIIFSKEFLFKDFKNTDLQSSKDVYNEKISLLYDNIRDFISFHYQGGRDDSEFWRWIKNEKIVSPRANHFYEKSKLQIPGFLEINGIIGTPNIALWNWISAGLGVIDPQQAKQELEAKYNIQDVGASFNNFLQYNLNN